MHTRLASSTACVLLIGAVLSAQTRVTPPRNKYTPAQDVELGREAAQEVRKTMPIMHDDAVESYVQNLGKRLADAIRPDLRRSEFTYTFETVNVKELNAFALPGGPMFVHRGMIEAAKNEGELAGVMAHEISHVTLRHGTAQATKASRFQWGELVGAVAGAVIGGAAGSVVSQGTSLGLGAYFLRYSRDYERQADIEGAQLMARAGYNPADMASMFRTLEQEARSSGPEWLSSHPNPGNRSEYITREARSIRVADTDRGSHAFDRVREHLRSLTPAPSTEEATKRSRRSN